MRRGVLVASARQPRLRLLLGAREIAPHDGATEFTEDLKVVRGGA